MMQWIDVVDSTRIIAMAYEEESETIYVRFPNGVEWFYSQCPRQTWEEFQVSPKGEYIHSTLNSRPNGRYG